MDDWRITNQRSYLYKVKIQKCNISKFPEKDHEHCSFCWDKFGCYDGMLKEGYSTEDGRHWICESCYRDFKKVFEWELID